VQLPPGYTARPPRTQDGPAIVEMWNRESLALIGVPVASLDWVTAPWVEEAADLEQDFAVIMSGSEEIVGYLSLVSDPPHTTVFSVGGVSLEHHGRGLGAAILCEAERRAQRFTAMAPTGDRVVLHIGALSDEPRFSALLRSQGFAEVRRFWSMRVRFDGLQSPPDPMPGIEIRSLGAGEEGAVYDCLAEAFQDRWGEGFETEPRWLARYAEGEDFEPGLWRVAWQGESVVGSLVGEPTASQEPELGYVALLGVRAEARGRGIAEALLRSSFAGFQQRGRSGALLLVDSESETGATRLYERVGMHPEPRFSTWEKALRDADQG
jgi:mycothiol synthase